MGMFDNYPAPVGYVPNNQPEKLYRSIQQGATETIEFSNTIPASSISTVSVSFIQGFDIIVSKETPNVSVTNSLITVALSQSDTLKFDPFTPAYAQVKIKYTENNSVNVVCSVVERFVVLPVINKNEL